MSRFSTNVQVGLHQTDSLSGKQTDYGQMLHVVCCFDDGIASEWPRSPARRREGVRPGQEIAAHTVRATLSEPGPKQEVLRGKVTLCRRRRAAGGLAGWRREGRDQTGGAGEGGLSLFEMMIRAPR